jgi:phosphatidate cytidylyltransferase
MTDDQHPDEPIDDEPWPEDGPRSEGVRIIGAQEAAEAVGRPDVARRRRRGEKRFGDRPDQPAPASDLPTIRISSSGATTTGGDDAPVVRPASPDAVHPSPPEPRWGDDTGSGFGHARVIDDSGATGSDADDPFPADAFEDVSPVGPDPEAENGSEAHLDPVGYPEQVEVSGSVEDTEPAEDPWDFVEEQRPVGEAQPDADTTAVLDPVEERPASEWSDPAPSADAPSDVDLPPSEDPSGDVGWPPPSETQSEPTWAGEAMGDDERGSVDDDSFGDEDSFVLPHWTEPATGQVPRVVGGDDHESDQPGTGASQPRWRDEGERTSESDFTDLVEDAPRLGALAADTPTTELGDSFFDDDVDPMVAFGPEGDEERPSRRRRTRRRVVDDDWPDDDGGAEPPGGSAARSAGRGGSDGDDGAGGFGDRNLPTAVAVGVGLVAIGLFMFWLGGLATTVLATVVVGVAALEYFRAVQTRGQQPATLLGLTAVVALLVGTYFAGLAAYPVVLALTVVLGLLWYLWVTPGERAVQHLGFTLVGVFWIGFLGSFATLLLGLGRQMQANDPGLTSNPGIGVLIAAVIASVAHDVGAYFVGRRMGRTRLSTASPNKTQEGLAGGFVASLVATVVVVGIGGISPIGDDLARTFVFALLCALVAPLGDLCESFIKRDLGIKDMGSVLPGHGGVLDRFDALLFVLPTAYFVTLLFQIWTPA